MNCPKCQKPLPEGATFCPDCGTNPRTYQADDGLNHAKTIGFEEPDRTTDGDLAAESMFAGRYKVQRKLGQGGMGVVYVATDSNTGGEVVLKLIHPRLVSGPEAVKRLLAEGLLARQIRHPNIVAVFDVAQWEGQPYFTMEYIRGGSLRSWLVAKSSAATDVSLPTAAGLVANILDGVAEAHRMGVVHRDLKPENVMLVGNPDAGDLSLKILDFGIAKAVGGTRGEAPGGGQLGTPLYMAPEQMRAADTVGPQADIYAISVIFYEMLMETSPQARWEPISGSRKDVPKAIDDLIEKGLSARPRSRQGSVAEYRAELNAALAGGGTARHDPPPEPPPPPPPERRDPPPPPERREPQPPPPPPPPPPGKGFWASMSAKTKLGIGAAVLVVFAMIGMMGGDSAPNLSGTWRDNFNNRFTVQHDGLDFSGSANNVMVNGAPSGTVTISGEVSATGGNIEISNANGVIFAGPGGMQQGSRPGDIDVVFGPHTFHVNH